MNDFRHVIVRGTAPKTLLLLHGTGGDENNLVGLGRNLAPEATLWSPRGQVLENGAPRFFRRFAEGVPDIDDWRARSAALAQWLRKLQESEGIPPCEVTALGYSNGANIAQGLLLLHPEVLCRAILLRPMFMTEDVPSHDLSATSLLILVGNADPLMRPGEPGRLHDLYTARSAACTVDQIPASHGLVPEDVKRSARWLAAWDS